MLLFLASWLALCGVSAPPASGGQTVTLQPADISTIPRIMPKVIVVRPKVLALKSTYPDTLAKIPASFKTPVFGTLQFGPADNPKTVIVGVQEREEDAPDIRVDVNANGDLTDDPPLHPVRSKFVRKDGVTLTEYTVTPTIPIPYETTTSLLTVNIRWLDRQDVRRTDGSTPILYYANYFTKGQLRLGEKTYPIALADTRATGDFRGTPTGEVSNVLLLIDRNGNDLFDPRGEGYDIRQPFTIDGTTYQITAVDPSGLKFTLVKSPKTVAEILPPPDLRPGKSVVAFTGKTLEGKKIAFPEDYKGKLVLLYFWGSWCGDCQAEVPYWATAWQRFKGKGVEFLGISVDYPDYGTQLAAFIKKNSLPPDHIYAGKHWNADIAVLYGVMSIPTTYLVEGDTGKVVAWGDDLLEERLVPTLERMLINRRSAQEPALPFLSAPRSASR